MTHNQVRDPFLAYGQEVTKMQHRAFMLYSRDYIFAKTVFPEFEQHWQMDKDQWLQEQASFDEDYYQTLVDIYRHK
jgi:hypothetical protein